MWRYALIGFLLAHGLIHLSYLSAVPARRPGAPPWAFHLERTWLHGAVPLPAPAVTAGRLLAAGVVAAFAVAAVALLARADWAVAAIRVAAGLSLAQLLVWFHPWLLAGILIDIALLVAAWRVAS